MICKTCNKHVHYCNSCGRDNYLDEGYCCKECLEKSEEFNENKELFMNFYFSLNKKQKEYFKHIYNEFTEIYNYYYTEDWIDKLDKE